MCFVSSNVIVADALQEAVEENQPVPFKKAYLSKKPNLQRTANRVREATQPTDPRDLQFVLEEDHIPDGKESNLKTLLWELYW